MSREAMTQGVVTQHLVSLIARQVDDHGLVVWYDAERHYQDVAAGLTIPETAIARYDGSFFALRREIDHLLNGLGPPRLVVYVPLDQADTHHALAELEAAGVVMRPGQQPPNRNTKLAVVARNALRPILGDEQVAEIEKQVETGKLSLANLNSLAEKGKDISSGILSLIFGTANPQEVALALLHDDRYDDEIEKKSAQIELLNLLQTGFDIDLSSSPTPANLRGRLARHVLLTDLVAALGEQTPRALASVKLAASPGGVDACVRLARSWRNDREYRDGYVEAANKVERELPQVGALASSAPSVLVGSRTLASSATRGQVGTLTSSAPSVLVGSRTLASSATGERARNAPETFLALERAMLRQVEESLLAAATPELLETAHAHLSGFWAEVEPAVQARWALIAAAAEVLLEADRVAVEIKGAPEEVPALVKAYAQNDQPWCLLDTHHRHLECRKYNFDFDGGGRHEGLEKLIAKAERRYVEVGSALAKYFVTQFQKARHPIAGLTRQRDVFQTRVKPRLGDGKLAYVWVDALRFEMARELCRLLKDDCELTLEPLLGTVPTITEIGMAALLPKADESAKVVAVGGGKLALEIDGTVVKDRKDRVAFLKRHAGVPVFDCKLDDLLPKPSKKVRDGIQSAELVLVTSQEIDEFGESDTKLARLHMDSMLTYLRRMVRILGDQGVRSIVLAADHGYLFADEIGDDMKIESPGGKVEDLHRRVWVGLGGTSQPSYLRTSLASLGIESEFDIATPWPFACFKSKGGARAYFHGGLSPQELIVPLVVLTTASRRAAPSTAIDWTLKPGTAKLTTRFFSVQVAGTRSESGLFGFEPPKVRVEVRADKKCVSQPVSASYGFEDATGEVKLKVAEADAKRIEPNTVTVMISEEIESKTVVVHLADAATGMELGEPLTIEVAISM
ncbi:MAG TPA: PglZ domain-containing protein [Pirellulales bacterium]|nr:PglZ domain-containing protein [Pirellulales bacterium]